MIDLAVILSLIFTGLVMFFVFPLVWDFIKWVFSPITWFFTPHEPKMPDYGSDVDSTMRKKKNDN